MKIEKNVRITLSNDEICEIIAKHLSDTTKQEVSAKNVYFNVKNRASEFGGQPTPYLDGCEINLKG